MSDDDRKTWVFPIVGFSTDLCVRFSERMRSMMRRFGMDFFFFFFVAENGWDFFFFFWVAEARD